MYTIEMDLNPITRIRWEKGLTTYQLAKKAGLSQSRIAQVENGIQTKKIPKKLLVVVEELGYEPKEIQEEYLAWLERKAKAGKTRTRILITKAIPSAKEDMK